MPRLKNDFGVVAWKTYTQWGPDGEGYFLSDEKHGIPFLKAARDLDVKRVAVHKGIPFGRQSYRHSLCDDIGEVARRFPDIHFLVYHSGFVPGQSEGPYDPARNEGIDSLVKTVLDNELGHGSNVYAELGSTWRYLMRDPDSAAHTLGKLMKYLGEDNVLWGTDSIWYGSPQDQIQAFRAFEISEELQEKHGYPALTAERDHVAAARASYRQDPRPHFGTFGPRNRREFMNLMRWSF